MVSSKRAQAAAFGEWLDITLSNKGVQGRRVADAVGVSDATVSRWRSGLSLPDQGQLVLIAELLELDPRRLAVTAGVLPPAMAPGVEPYPMPEPTAQRDAVRRQIAKIKGLTEDGREKLLATYDQMILEAPAEED